MLNLPKQQYIIILLVGALLVGGGVTLWRQYHQPPAVEGLQPVLAEEEPQLEPGEVVVHVAGAVKRSGVYRLPEGSRVVDAVEAAGGGTEDADIHALNLADILIDGQRYYVPTVEETTSAGGTYSGSGTGKINLNRATKAELETLPGIGPTLAERIISYREQQGPFRRPEDLKNVSGIGDKIYDNLKDRIYAP
ncbi:MAG TPA: ComEA family DNA-binding protein [Firmicutes bacterium]|nr:ComEA family DNA-binding protein [Bacillota bacterium]